MVWLKEYENIQHSFISLSIISSQPSKKYVGEKSSFDTVLWDLISDRSIGPIVKKIGDLWVVEIMIFDMWLEWLFFVIVQYPDNCYI